MSEATPREVLDRLLRLNYERYAEEVAPGLHEKGGKNGKSKKSGGKAKSTRGAMGEQQELMFD